MATAAATVLEALFSPMTKSAAEAAEKVRLADLSSAAAEATEKFRLAKEVAAASAAEEIGKNPGSAALPMPMKVELVPKKKWPKDFPEFVGRGYFEGSKEFGTGVGRCCSETSYTDYEASTTDPTVFRMKYHNKVLNYGKESSAEQEARVGVREVSWRYFQADHDRGCFELLGGQDLLDECEMIVTGDKKGKHIVPFSLWKGDHKCNGDGTRGGWTFRTNTRQRLQLVLSDDLTVLRGVNRADPKTGADKVGDFLESASYRFARAPGRGRKLAEDLVPLADDTEKKIKLLAAIFHPGNKFRKEDEKGKLTVSVDARFVKVNRIDTLDDQFGAEAKVVFEFQITKSDAAQYVNAGDNKAGWVPAGAPNPVFEELNQAVGVDAAPVRIVPGPFTLQRRDGEVMVARRTITITGDFYECFELQSYPFDSQPLRIQLRSTGTMPVEGFEFVHDTLFEDHECASGQRGLPKYVCWEEGKKGKMSTFQSDCTRDEEPSAWECVCAGEALDPQHSAWECEIDKQPKMMVEFKKQSDAGNRLKSIEGENVMGVLRVTLATLVVRKSSVYVQRVMATLAGFALLAIFSFATEGDPTQSILTVMLTAVAYSVVIAEDIPKLGYLTFLDKYVLGLTMGFMMLLSWVMWANAAGDDYNIGDDYCCWAALWIFTTMYFVGHITLFAHVQLHVFPTEAKKYETKLFLGDCLIDYPGKKKKKPSKSWPWCRAAKKPQQTRNGEEIMAAMAGSPDVQKAIVDYLDSPKGPRKRIDFDGTPYQSTV